MTSSDFRARARQMLAGKWGMALLISLIAGILGGLIVGSFAGIEIDLDAEIMEYIPEGIRNILNVYLIIAGSVGSVLGIAQFVLGGVVRLGYCQYMLKLHDGKEGDLKDLFSQFGRFADGFVLSLLTGIYVFLWSLLFVIPGIVAAYKYSMAPFILLENPGMKPKEAIEASKRMMDGNKGDLFILDLSFIGWHLLCGLTLGIGELWLNPYLNAAYTAFYRNLSPLPVVVNEPADVVDAVTAEEPEVVTEIPPEAEI